MTLPHTRTEKGQPKTKSRAGSRGRGLNDSRGAAGDSRSEDAGGDGRNRLSRVCIKSQIPKCSKKIAKTKTCAHADKVLNKSGLMVFINQFYECP